MMGLFYHKLWKGHKPPLAALREAQLYLYHHADRIGVLALRRAVDFKEDDLPGGAPAPAPAP
jgi:hypothetical protein